MIQVLMEVHRIFHVIMIPCLTVLSGKGFILVASDVILTLSLPHSGRIPYNEDRHIDSRYWAGIPGSISRARDSFDRDRDRESWGTSSAMGLDRLPYPPRSDMDYYSDYYADPVHSRSYRSMPPSQGLYDSTSGYYEGRESDMYRYPHPNSISRRPILPSQSTSAVDDFSVSPGGPIARRGSFGNKSKVPPYGSHDSIPPYDSETNPDRYNAPPPYTKPTHSRSQDSRVVSENESKGSSNYIRSKSDSIVNPALSTPLSHSTPRHSSPNIQVKQSVMSSPGKLSR